MRYAYLIKVEANANNNKYYEMYPDLSGTSFTVKYGRVGGHESSKPYDSRLFDSKYKEKIKGGYTDITHLKVESSNQINYTGKAAVDAFLLKIVKASQEAFSQSYTVSASSVTLAQVVEVNRLIKKINEQKTVVQTVDDLHQLFIEMWRVLPRDIGRSVKDALPKHMDSVDSLLALEQETIDNAQAQLALLSSGTETSVNLTDKLGIQIEEVTDVPQEVATLLGDGKIKSLFRVTKPIIRERFSNFVDKARNRKTVLRFHGTRWKNGLPILNTGLLILGRKSPTYSGSMLGDAIYCSREFRKSQGYSDGLMFILNIHVGNVLEVGQTNQIINYSYKDLLANGYDSVNAEPGVYTGRGILQRHEQTIYNEAQHDFLYALEF